MKKVFYSNICHVRRGAVSISPQPYHMFDICTKESDNGYLKLMGRKKDIIIRAGQNIYPKEIKDYLLAHPKVTNGVLVPYP